jgi:hypothetical protein
MKGTRDQLGDGYRDYRKGNLVYAGALSLLASVPSDSFT